MNSSGLLQEARSIYDSMNIPKIWIHFLNNLALWYCLMTVFDMIWYDWSPIMGVCLNPFLELAVGFNYYISFNEWKIHATVFVLILAGLGWSQLGLYYLSIQREKERLNCYYTWGLLREREGSLLRNKTCTNWNSFYLQLSDILFQVNEKSAILVIHSILILSLLLTLADAIDLDYLTNSLVQSYTGTASIPINMLGAVVMSINPSLCKPGVASSITSFTSLSYQTLSCEQPVASSPCIWLAVWWDVKHKHTIYMFSG